MKLLCNNKVLYGEIWVDLSDSIMKSVWITDHNQRMNEFVVDMIIPTEVPSDHFLTSDWNYASGVERPARFVQK